MLNFKFHYFPGWVGGGWWVGVEIENKANSVQLELELGLSLAIIAMLAVFSDSIVNGHQSDQRLIKCQRLLEIQQSACTILQ